MPWGYWSRCTQRNGDSWLGVIYFKLGMIIFREKADVVMKNECFEIWKTVRSAVIQGRSRQRLDNDLNFQSRPKKRKWDFFWRKWRCQLSYLLPQALRRIGVGCCGVEGSLSNEDVETTLKGMAASLDWDHAVAFGHFLLCTPKNHQLNSRKPVKS